MQQNTSTTDICQHNGEFCFKYLPCPVTGGHPRGRKEVECPAAPFVYKFMYIYIYIRVCIYIYYYFQNACSGLAFHRLTLTNETNLTNRLASVILGVMHVLIRQFFGGHVFNKSMHGCGSRRLTMNDNKCSSVSTSSCGVLLGGSCWGGERERNRKKPTAVDARPDKSLSASMSSLILLLHGLLNNLGTSKSWGFRHRSSQLQERLRRVAAADPCVRGLSIEHVTGADDSVQMQRSRAMTHSNGHHTQHLY